MKKKRKSAVHLLLVLILLASTVMGFPMKASAEATVSYLTVDPPGVMYLSEPQRFKVTATMADGTTRDVTEDCTYTASQLGHFGVSPGILQPGVIGFATLTVSYGGASIQVPVEVPNSSIMYIAADSNSLTVCPGMPMQLKVKAYTADLDKNNNHIPWSWSGGMDGDVTSLCRYSSSDPSVATVSASGLVTGVALGNATISAWLPGGLLAHVSVTVNNVTPKSLTVSPPETSWFKYAAGPLTVTASMADGTTRDVTSASTFTSSNTSIATVDASGYLYVKNDGNFTITVSYWNLSYQYKVTYVPPVTGIIVNPDQITVGQGETAQVSVKAQRADGSMFDVTGSCDYALYPTPLAFKQCAGISSTGLITGVSPGQMTLVIDYVDVYPRPRATIPVTVVAVPNSISAAPHQVTLNKNGTRQLAITVQMSDGSSSDVTGSSSFHRAIPV